MKSSFENLRRTSRRQSEFERRHLLAQDFSLALKVAFRNGIKQTLESSNDISEKVKLEILKREYDALKVEFYESPITQTQKLEELGFADYSPLLRNDETLFVIHLPRIMLAYKLFKESSDNAPQNFFELLTILYERGINAVWDAARVFAVEHRLYFDRINPIGKHDSSLTGYYYLWVLSPHQDSLSSNYY